MREPARRHGGEAGGPAGGVDDDAGSDCAAVVEIESMSDTAADRPDRHVAHSGDVMPDAGAQLGSQASVVERGVGPREPMGLGPVRPHFGACGRDHCVDVEQFFPGGVEKVVGPRAVGGAPLGVIADQRDLDPEFMTRPGQRTPGRAVADHDDVDGFCRGVRRRRRSH